MWPINQIQFFKPWLRFLNSILLIIYSPLFEINNYTIQLFVLTYFSLLVGLVMQLSVVASVAVSLSTLQSAALSVAVLTALTWALRCTVSLLCKVTLMGCFTVSPAHCLTLLAGLHSGWLAVSLLSCVCGVPCFNLFTGVFLLLTVTCCCVSQYLMMVLRLLF